MIDYEKIFSEFPVWESDIIKLRQLNHFDIPSYHRICQDPDFIKEFLPEGTETSLQLAEHGINVQFPQSFREQKDLTWAVILKEGGKERLIGIRDLFIDSPFKPVVTQGFILSEYRNNGYNQEVLLLIINFLTWAGAHELRFNCNIENSAVIHIANKYGFDDITPRELKMTSKRRLFSIDI